MPQRAPAGTIQRPAIVNLHHEDAFLIAHQLSRDTQRQQRPGELPDFFARGKIGERVNADAVDRAFHDRKGITIRRDYHFSIAASIPGHSTLSAR